MKTQSVSLVLMTLGMINAAQAHHSASQFDLTSLSTIQGTVAKFQWTNPHVFIQLLTTDANGKTVEWAIEGPNPGGLVRVGWHSDSIKPGDKITVTFNPLRAGGAGGFVQGVVLANGRLLGQTDVQKMRIEQATAGK